MVEPSSTIGAGELVGGSLLVTLLLAAYVRNRSVVEAKLDALAAKLELFHARSLPTRGLTNDHWWRRAAA